MTSAEIAYLFRHALLRDAAYELQPPGERAAMHRLAAQLIELAFGRDESQLQEVALELADHIRTARGYRDDPELEKKERDYCEMAAEFATRSFRSQDAIRMRERLIEIGTPQDMTRQLVKLADLLELSARFDDALEASERALKIAEDLDDPVAEADAALLVGNLVVGTGKRDRALQLFEHARELYRQAGDAEGQTRARGEIAGALSNTTRAEDADEIFRQVIEEFSSLGNDLLAAQAKGNYAELCRRFGRFDEAIQLLREAIRVTRGRKPVAEVVFLGNLSAGLQQAGRPEEAGESIREAIELAGRYGLKAQEARLLCIHAMQVSDRGQMQVANSQHRHSLLLAREAGNRRFELINLVCMGNNLLYAEKFNEAEPLYREALDIAGAIGDKENELVALDCLGALYNNTRRHAEAERMYQEALRIAEATASLGKATGCRFNLGIIKQETGRPDEALPVYEACLQEFRAQGNRGQEASALCRIGLLQVSQGKLPQARNTWQQGYGIMREIQAGRSADAALNLMHETCHRHGVEPLC